MVSVGKSSVTTQAGRLFVGNSSLSVHYGLFSLFEMHNNFYTASFLYYANNIPFCKRCNEKGNTSLAATKAGISRRACMSKTVKAVYVLLMEFSSSVSMFCVIRNLEKERQHSPKAASVLFY